MLRTKQLFESFSFFLHLNMSSSKNKQTEATFKLTIHSTNKIKNSKAFILN